MPAQLSNSSSALCLQIRLAQPAFTCESYHKEMTPLQDSGSFSSLYAFLGNISSEPSLDYLYTQLFYETMLELMSQITVTKMFVKSLLKSYICIMYNLSDNQNIMPFSAWLAILVSFPGGSSSII